MAEIGTFSALVDEAIRRSGRRDRTSDTIAYARTTIRECTVLAKFDQTLVELQLTATAPPFIWKRPFDLRKLEALQYPYFTRRGNPIFPEERKPGTAKNSDLYYYYVSGDSYVFAGLKSQDVIDIAYLSYARTFKYYATASERPATFDDETQTWTYLDAYDDNADLMQQAEDMVTNWLIFRWFDLIVEGILAKQFKQLGDERSRSTFALYKSMQKDLLAGERILGV